MKKILLASATSAAILLAGCTSTQVAANILAGCTVLGAGAQAVATVSGLLPDGTAINSVVGGIITDVTNDCPTFANDVANVVAGISNIGGSGTVTVAAQTAAMKRTGERMKVSAPFHFGPYGS